MADNAKNIFAEQIKFAQDEINSYLQSLVPAEPRSLYDPVRYIIEAGGKRLRPVLTYLCTLQQQDCNWLPAAAAVEMLHTFTLVHDDIMDNAATRRGLKTLHELYDLNTAILAGDVLIALAETSLASGKYNAAPEMMLEFANAFRYVCEGQALDKEFEKNNSVSTEDYFRMIDLKSAKMIELAAVLGGYAWGMSDVEPLRLFAHHLGLAFQLRDDLLDLTSQNASFGKSIGGDIIEGKRTFLFLRAYESIANISEAEQQLLTRILHQQAKWDDVEPVRTLFTKIGVIEESKKMIADHTNIAQSALEKIELPDLRTGLQHFSEYLLHREH